MIERRPGALHGPEASAAAATPGLLDEGRQRRGMMLIMLAGCFWSLSGILIRNIEAANEWQILCLRSLALSATLFLVLAARHRGQVFRRFRAVGRAGVVGGLCLAAGFSAFIFALTSTTVANAVFILSAAPLATALLARLLLGEAVRRATWIAMAAALIGIAVMVGGGIRAGALFGNMMALLAMLGFSGFAVALRAGRSDDMLPTACLAGLFAAPLAALMAGDLAVSAQDLAISIAMGVVQVGAGMVLFIQGARHVPAAELALLSLTEVVLAPLWVWLGLGEVPSLLTLLGGAIVLAALVGRALSGLQRKPPPFGSV
jgi:drug/metabolite transporter (DMT)-like permease